jgi:hypothetical protein
MTHEKPKTDDSKKADRLEDLRPDQDPKGGQGTTQAPLRTSLRNEPGGWDANHHITTRRG